MAYSPDGNSEHRTRLRGVVTWAWPNLGFFLHDDAGSVRVFPASPTNPAVGDVVDVVGFPAPNLDRPVLREAILQTIGQTNTPPPRIPSPDELANPTTSHVCEGDLITLEGVALNAFEQHQYHASFLVEAHGKTFRIRHLNHWPLPKPDHLVGSRVRVTGICTRPPPESPSSSPDGFSLWMRDANDLAILGASPQRRQRQALWGLGALLAAILLATTHTLTLRRRVRSQTEAIRQREAALEERWLDLFENANDIIYTHDLQGVITSVNNSGQDLLGVPAQQIIGTRIQDWVDPADLPLVHQQIAAKTAGSTPRTAYELRLRTPSGQRLVLEVNSRLILHDGSPSGIQGIARDITDRKEAEEALRSSERQLRASLEERDRLGRDLHDGLIQSIYAAGLALDDCSRLLHSDPASAESRLRTITTDLNRVIREVRSFINRIEQDPLSGAEFTSALESLATTTSSPSNPALRIETNVDPSAAHRLHPHQATHLLQITREALANSLRHANPQLISISLQNSRAGIQFEVRDDGRGFDPSLPNPKGRGLRNITTRADRLGAWLHIESAPNQGTRLVLDIPTNSPHDPQPRSQPQS
jgi:PAS domain S-box-containing protein